MEKKLPTTGEDVEIENILAEIMISLYDLSPEKKMIVLDLLSERVFAEIDFGDLGEFGEEWVRMFPMPG